jgi:hypothetical protein
LSKLPPDSDILDTFARLRADNNLSDEEALLKFTTSYDVPLSTLNQISFSRLPASFSNVKCKEVAPYVWLDPGAEGSDILPLKTFRSRIPADLFGDICMDVDIAMEQYGRLEDDGNEEARSRFITSLFSRIVSLFGHAVTNNPEELLESEFAKKGKDRTSFYCREISQHCFHRSQEVHVYGQGKTIGCNRAGSCRMCWYDLIFPSLPPRLTEMCMIVACDYTNSKAQHWVPILAILCDGWSFQFLVYDSGSKSVYSSGTVTGLGGQGKQASTLRVIDKRR